MAWAAHGVGGSKTKTRTRVRALLNSVKVRSTQVLFCQDTGFANFSDGRWVAQTMREILSGQLDPASLPLLRVVKAEDGRLFSLDNRRLYCFQECGVGWINVEMTDTKGEEGEVNEEYMCKRFGNSNGTTSQGLVLKMKPVDGGKNAMAAVAAIMPCPACNTGAVQRLRQVRFVKGSKRAALPYDCDQCSKLVRFCKRETNTKVKQI